MHLEPVPETLRRYHEPSGGRHDEDSYTVQDRRGGLPAAGARGMRPGRRRPTSFDPGRNPRPFTVGATEPHADTAAEPHADTAAERHTHPDADANPDPRAATRSAEHATAGLARTGRHPA
jgi:hypothetical protein